MLWSTCLLAQTTTRDEEEEFTQFCQLVKYFVGKWIRFAAEIKLLWFLIHSTVVQLLCSLILNYILAFKLVRLVRFRLARQATESFYNALIQWEASRFIFDFQATSFFVSFLLLFPFAHANTLALYLPFVSTYPFVIHIQGILKQLPCASKSICIWQSLARFY